MCCAFCTKHLNFTIDNTDYRIPAFAGMTSILVVGQESNNGGNLPLNGVINKLQQYFFYFSHNDEFLTGFILSAQQEYLYYSLPDSLSDS